MIRPATDKQRAMLRARAQTAGLTIPTSAQLSNLDISEVSDVVRKLDNRIDVFGSGHRPFEPVAVEAAPAAVSASPVAGPDFVELQELVLDLMAAHTAQAASLRALAEAVGLDPEAGSLEEDAGPWSASARA
jgi:hypothetical protein